MAGTLILNFLTADVTEKIKIDRLFGEAAGQKTNVEYFVQCFRKIIAGQLLILTAACAASGRNLLRLYCAFKGVMFAGLVYSSTVCYRFFGILYSFAVVFPHCFVYVPQLILTLHFAGRLNENMENLRRERDKSSGFRLFSSFADALGMNVRGILFYLTIIILSALAAFLKTYVNLVILKNIA